MMASHYDDGQPGCKTSEEVNKPFRNNWDPTSYWQCSVQGEPATKQKCPSSQVFLDSSRKCVNIWEWVWTDPVPPPSKP